MSKSAIVAALICIGLGCHSITAQAAVGRTSGTFNVSNTGAANYSIPIWTPPGINGIQPHLALSYSSQQGEGYAGVGWGIAGLGSISRCNRTFAQDGTPAAVTLTQSDVFCINGNRLLLKSGTYGFAGSTYQTEISDFSLITAVSTAGNGPASFSVRGKDGLIYSYGATSGAQVLASGTSTASSWLLSEVVDRNGNTMTITYQQTTGSAVPDTISWASNANQSVSANHKIVFNYGTNVLQSVERGFVAGTLVENTKLLNSIYVQTTGGTTLRSYFLNYAQAAATGRNLLKQVKECADAAQSDCLLPTTITYNEGQAGLSSSGTTLPVTLGGAFSGWQYDINGDGFQDLVFFPRDSLTYHVRFGSVSGYGAEQDTGLAVASNAYFGDVVGTGKTGLFVGSGASWAYYVWNGSSFVSNPVSLSVGQTDVMNGFADINGDGLPDLIISSESDYATHIRVYLNTSVNGQVSFAAALPVYDTTPFYYASISTSGAGATIGSHRKWDFNGDGREDILLVEAGSCENGCGPAIFNPKVLISTGTGFTAVALPAEASADVGVVDWNGDGCSDMLSTTRLFLSKCDGTMEQYSLPGDVRAVMDWDGDGQQDLLVVNAGTYGVYLSTSQGFSSLIATTIPYSDNCRPMVVDVNGDGLDDLTCWQVGQTTGSMTVYPHNAANALPDLLASITDGYGVTASPTYVSITQNNCSKYADPAHPDDPTFPEKYFNEPYYVVNQFTASDGVSSASTYSQQFWYYGAREQIQGRGFEGFGAKRVHDSRKANPSDAGGSYSYQYFRRDFPFTGSPLKEEVYQPDGTTLMHRVVNTWDKNPANGVPVFPFVSQSVSTDYEVGGVKNAQLITTATTTFSYDTYGNATNVSTMATDNDSGSPYLSQTWTTTTANTFASADTSSNWCVSVPTGLTVTNSTANAIPAVPAITRTVTFPLAQFDYAKCRVTQKITEPTANNGIYAVTEDYGFDGFGNMSSVKVTGAGMAARTTTTQWDPTGHFPKYVWNALSEKTEFNYDINAGSPISTIDPNNIVTSWQYDSFARKTRETRPDNTSTTWDYLDCATNGGCLVGTHALKLVVTSRNADTSFLTDAFTYFDSFDRPLIQAVRNLANSYDRSDVRYLAIGTVDKRSMPCAWTSVTAECSFWTSYTYDTAAREIQAARPISSGNLTNQYTTVQYLGRTTVVTDAEGKSSTKIATVAGTLGRSQDHNGYYQNFTYDAFGSLVAVTDSLSNTLSTHTYAYGIGAFKTGMTDMDLGSWGYLPNALGEIGTYTDANGATFNTIYDALSRPTFLSVSGEGATTWVWGNNAASFNIGRVYSIAKSGGPTEYYTYDNKGRISNRNIVSDASYSYDYTYNATSGFLDTLTYPASTSSYRLKLQYGYQNGILNQVKDFNSSGTVFWQANAANARGQIIQETFGNGLVSNRSYDAVTGWTNSVQCAIGGGTCAQNQSYLHDKVGNLTQRQNNNLGLTENFFYDNVYRLQSSQLNSSPNLTMGYDAMGNITSRSDIAGGAAWTYNNAHKHQVIQAGNASYTYSYDNNGNVINRNGNNITWNKYNYPTIINGNGETTSLFYDANDARWKQVYTKGAVTETTIYVGDQLQKVTQNGVDDYRYAISANGQTVAIMSRTTAGANNTSYILRDVQGTVAKLTNSSGAEVVSESFTAYGARRNPQTWAGLPTNGDFVTAAAITREGYTGQDALGNMGLNHMNGRLQDAITGRFLSADPYVTEPGNTQNYNRYSYVYNNPLSFVDPSGFDGLMSENCPSSTSVQAFMSCQFGSPSSYSSFTSSSSSSSRGSNSSNTLEGVTVTGTNSAPSMLTLSTLNTNDFGLPPMSTGEGNGGGYSTARSGSPPPAAMASLGPVNVLRQKLASARKVLDDYVGDIRASWGVWPGDGSMGANLAAFPIGGVVLGEAAVARGTTTVIGRTKDLGNLAKGERSLLDRLTPNLGNAQANWARNSGVLREEMRRGLPIRDVSPGDTAGTFLNAERALLRDRGWSFDPRTNFWNPPGP